MFKNKAALFSLVLAFSSAVACSKSNVAIQPGGIKVNASAGQPARIASVDVVKATPHPIDIARGQSGDTTVQLSIQHGYHINANPPSYPYLKATELEFPTASGISVGFIVYPNPVSKKFPFAEKPLNVYEGETTLKVQLKVDKSAPQGLRNLAGKLRVQACDDQVCYAPGTIDVSLPVNIK